MKIGLINMSKFVHLPIGSVILEFGFERLCVNRTVRLFVYAFPSSLSGQATKSTRLKMVSFKILFLKIGDLA